MASFTHFTQKSRIRISRIFAAIIIFLALFSEPSWERSHFAVSIIVDVLAFLLILIATFGRLWSLMYISGHKTKDLFTDGPYSLVRNPLYMFSFIGAFGIGLVSDNIYILVLLVLIFGLYYPFVIRGEEKNLLRVHGETFDEYRQKTPMLIPRFSLYHDEPTLEIDTRLFRRNFFSVVWFPLIFLILLLIERLHELGVLPVLFNAP